MFLRRIERALIHSLFLFGDILRKIKIAIITQVTKALENSFELPVSDDFFDAFFEAYFGIPV